MTYYKYINAAIVNMPQITMDDGLNLVSKQHKDRRKAMENVIGAIRALTVLGLKPLLCPWR